MKSSAIQCSVELHKTERAHRIPVYIQQLKHIQCQIATKPTNHRHYHHQSPLSPKVTLSRGSLLCKSSNEHAKLSPSFRWSMNKNNASEWKEKTFSEWNDSSVRLSQPLFTGFCVVKAAIQKPRHTHAQQHTACWLCCEWVPLWINIHAFAVPHTPTRSYFSSVRRTLL